MKTGREGGGGKGCHSIRHSGTAAIHLRIVCVSCARPSATVAVQTLDSKCGAVRVQSFLFPDYTNYRTDIGQQVWCREGTVVSIP